MTSRGCNGSPPAEYNAWSRLNLIIEDDEDSEGSSDARTITGGHQENDSGEDNGVEGKDTTRSRRSRRDDAMNSKVIRGRGRTPSPKRVPAPAPPSSRDCPSPVPKLVSTSDIYPADHQGWLIDQLRGRKVWCAVSDMLFCVFENEESRVSKQVILLPGCTVRHIEFKSASQEGKILNGVARHFASKTISGVDKFQFLIQNTVSRQTYMFGVASRPELDRWIDILEKACSLDVTSETAEEDQSDTISNGQSTPRSKSGSISPRSRSRENSDSSPTTPGYTVSQTLPRRIDVHSLSLSLTQPHDVSKDTVDDIRKRLRKEHHDSDTKPHPIKAKHDVEEKSDKAAVSASTDENSRKSRSFFKMKSPLDVLLRRKKRSSSADDAQSRRKLFPKMEPDAISNPSFSPRLSDSQSSLAPSIDSTQSLPSYDTSFTSSLDSQSSAPDKKKRNILSRSLDAQKNSSGLGSSLRRTASDLKDKMFGLGWSSKNGKSRSAGIKLKDLQDIRVSGCLQYRLAYKFTKVHCALCRGCFYAFRSGKPNESAVLAVVLNQCLVTYVAEPENRHKRLFAFKLSQPHCKSIYICTDDHQTLIKWMMAIQSEANKIQVDEELATEIREKRSSQKKRQAREAEMSQIASDLEAKRIEMQKKRNSCPNFADDEPECTPGKSGAVGTLWAKGNNRENKQIHRTKSDQEINIPIDIYDEKYSVLSSTGPSVEDSLESRGQVRPGSIESNEFSGHSSSGSGQNDNDTVSSETRTEISTSSEPSANQSHLRAFIPTHRRIQTSYNIDVQVIAQSDLKTLGSGVKRTASLDKQVFQRRAADDLGVWRRPTSGSWIKLQDTPGKTTSFFSSDSSSQASCSNGAVPNDKTDAGFNSDQNDFVDGHVFTAPSQSEARVTNSHMPYRLNSSVHDDATKEAWSNNEDFLLNLVKDKLRRRRQREPEEAAGIGGGANDVVTVNDQWNSAPSFKTSQSSWSQQQQQTTMSSEPANHDAGDHDVTDTIHHSRITGSVSDDVSQEAGEDEWVQIMEGHMEKRGFDDQWHRYWCVLRDGCLYCYLKPDDKVSSDVTELKGYDVTQLIDKFQGKRFVLSLRHTSYIDVLLSVDTRDELTDWYEAINSALEGLKKKMDSNTKNTVESQTQKGSLPSSSSTASASASASASADASQPSPSAQTVKQKLLAEMLRQKLELEKMQAARNGMKGDAHLDGKNRSSSPTLGSSLGTDDDRICALTRLRQRRMSTQIKLLTIQKEMEASGTSPREKKTVFQLGKKKPDLVQGHLEGHGHRSDLEEQIKLLSSRLQELDTCITSHGAISPREESPARVTAKSRPLRHSYDQSQLRDLVMSESKKDAGGEIDGDNMHRPKEKDVNRNSGLKSSVQKLAHRTFAKATWHWHKKSSNHNDNKDNVRPSSTGSSSNLSDLTPDVIDMTNNNSQSNNKYYNLDGTDIPAPPDNFRTEYTLLTSTLPHRGKSGTLHRTPKERLLSKLSSSSSLTHLDRFNSRLQPSSSTPSLAKLATKQGDEKERHSVRDSVDGGIVPKLTNGSLEGNSTWSAPNSARSQGSSGFASPRREVNPNILAEIEAFEELSMKVLGSSASSK